MFAIINISAYVAHYSTKYVNGKCRKLTVNCKILKSAQSTTDSHSGALKSVVGPPNFASKVGPPVHVHTVHIG